MERLKFTSLLSPNDIRLFLVKYGGMQNCSLLGSSTILSSIHLVQHFFNESMEYVLTCNDFSMIIRKVINGVLNSTFEIRPNEDDWFCFLKSRFQKDYIKHYSSYMDADDLIYTQPKYISQLSFNEMLILIKRILEQNSSQKYITLEGMTVVEVESFFRSERRFWISNKSKGEQFYLRLSDFQIISPRLSSAPLYKFMYSMFREKYEKAFNESIRVCLKPEARGKFFITQPVASFKKEIPTNLKKK